MMMIDMERRYAVRGFVVHIRCNSEHVAIDVNDFHRMPSLRTRRSGHHDAAEQQRDRKDKAGKENRHRSPTTMEMAAPQCGQARSPVASVFIQPLLQ